MITAPNGSVVIREGDDVALGVANVPSALVPGCPARPTWAIAEIASVNGQTPPGSPAAAPTRRQNPPK